VGKKPRYRKVRKYYKSSEHYWRERNRRKQVLQLLEEEHLSQRQIAERLKISERTVKRDVARIRPYYMRKVRHQLNLLRKEVDEKFEAELEGKSLLEQLKILSRKMAERNKLLKLREYQRHQIYVTIDLDHFVSGYPGLRVWPQKSTTGFRMPITVNFLFVKDGETKSMGNVTFSSVK